MGLVLENVDWLYAVWNVAALFSCCRVNESVKENGTEEKKEEKTDKEEEKKKSASRSRSRSRSADRKRSPSSGRHRSRSAERRRRRSRSRFVSNHGLLWKRIQESLDHIHVDVLVFFQNMGH